VSKLGIETLIKLPVAWLSPEAPESPIAISSRIRLARNLEHLPFPGQASPEQRDQVLATIRKALPACGIPWRLQADLSELDDLERDILLERRLINEKLCLGGNASAVAVNEDASLSLTINEQDHLRLQILLPGLQLRQAWQQLDTLDARLGQQLNLAFDETLGFLSSNPSNLGTGLRASVMLHLPALSILDQLTPITRAASELGLEIRGLFGEGSRAIGGYFQISNQTTLGLSEDEILNRLEIIINRLIWSEKNARFQLLRKNRDRVYDYVGRAYGLLRYAAIMPSEEAIEHLSALNLGVCLGLFPRLTLPMLMPMLVLLQPGHLQVMAGGELTTPDRDARRAQILRGKLSLQNNRG
jgi:protein arginine kinase